MGRRITYKEDLNQEEGLEIAMAMAILGLLGQNTKDEPVINFVIRLLQWFMPKPEPPKPICIYSYSPMYGLLINVSINKEKGVLITNIFMDHQILSRRFSQEFESNRDHYYFKIGMAVESAMIERVRPSINKLYPKFVRNESVKTNS